MNLQKEIDNLYIKKNGIPIFHYHKILRECVSNKEFAATVFVYDHLLKSGNKATQETFDIIEKLHSKTIQENNNIILKPTMEKHLSPRRRIHKIIKGHNYSSNYESAKKYKSKVKTFLDSNINLISLPRIKLAKTISKDCSITFNDARYIITSLKRDGYFKKNINGNQHTLDYYFNK